MIQLAKLLFTGLLKVQKYILIISSVFIIIGIAAQASFRYFFSIDFFGFEEVIVILAFWLYFIGASIGSYEGSHIKADIIPTYIKNEKVKDTIMLITSLITIVISLLYSYWSLEYIVWLAEKTTTTAVLKIPVLFSRVSILTGFLLMSFYFIIHFYHDLKSYTGEKIKKIIALLIQGEN